LTGGGSILLGEHRCSARIVAFTPDNGTLISAAGTGLPHGSLPGELKFWNVADRVERKTVAVFDENIHTLTLAPGGKRLAVGGRQDPVRIVDVATGNTENDVPKTWERTCSALAFSADGGRLAVGDENGNLVVWDLVQGQELMNVRARPEDQRFVSGLAFLPGGRQVVGTTGVPPGREAMIKVWSLDRKQLDYEIRHGDSHIFCMALHPDGRTLATGCQNGRISLWDLDRRVRTQELFDHGENSVRSLCFSADGRLLASGASGGTALLWHAVP
jgi:WD40 repeat protein